MSAPHQVNHPQFPTNSDRYALMNDANTWALNPRVLRVPSAPDDEVLAILDEYASIARRWT